MELRIVAWAFTFNMVEICRVPNPVYSNVVMTGISTTTNWIVKKI
jgi:hypothetical protein